MKWLMVVFTACLLAFGWAWGSDDLPERIVLATHDQVWYPIDYPDERGQFIGPWMEQLNELFVETLDVELEVTRQPWRRAQADVQAGRADIMITLPTEERLAYTDMAEGVFYTMTFQLLVSREHPDWEQIKAVQDLDDLQRLGLTLVSTFSNGWFEQNVADRGIEADYVKTDRQQIQFLLSGRADGLIDFPVTMAPLLQQMDPDGGLVFLPAVLDRTEFRILVSTKSPWIHHIDALEAAVKRMEW